MNLPKVTREEMYLAYLNGDYNVKLPTPVTNEEHYLYELCMNKSQGGTGGVTSWNDLTDKPFYRELEESVIILQEQTFYAIDGTIDFPIFSLILGETYSIRWNGALYTCVAQDATPLMGMESVMIGNSGALMGEEGTGEPFLILTTDAEGGMSRGIALDGSTSVKIRLAGPTYVYHTLSDAYIEKNPVMINLEPVNGADGEYKSVESFEDIFWMITVEKKMVILSLTEDSNKVFFNLASANPNYLRFSAMNIASDGVGFTNMDLQKGTFTWYSQTVRINSN